MAPTLAKSLNRLSRQAIIDLALEWLQQSRSSAPYLSSNRTLCETEEEDYLHTPAESIGALRSLYQELQNDGNLTKREVIDRIVDGDWRRGLSLHQLAMVDFAYVEQNDTALKWSALRLVPLEYEDQKLSEGSESRPPRKKRKLLAPEAQPTYPQVPAQTFLSALKEEVSCLVKAHYHLHRIPAPYNLTILRIYISPDAAFAPSRSKIPRRIRHATDAGRVLYVALPDSCPYVYISISGSSSSSRRSRHVRDSKDRHTAKVDIAAMKRVVLEAIPKAMSRPHQRWALESTKLVARSLRTMCELRGNQIPGSGGGAYSIFAAGGKASQRSPVDVQIEARKEMANRESLLQQRFGDMTHQHHAALGRFHVKIGNVMQHHDDRQDRERSGGQQNDLSLTLSGSDVFLGIKKLAELGPECVDLHKMPAWMTGELGVSSLAV